MQKSVSHSNVVDLSEELFQIKSSCEVTERTWTVIPGRLSFEIHRDDEDSMERIKSNPRIFYFSNWIQESYEPFCSDFGPVNLANVVRFCHFLGEKMHDPRLTNRHLVYYCDPDTAYVTNAAFLLGAYLVLVEKCTPEHAAMIFSSDEPTPFRMFRDATHAPSTFDLSLLDCFRGLQRAVEAGWLDYQTFDVEQYDLLNDSAIADAHVVCPKFVAFRGPRDTAESERWDRDPQQYVPLFKHLQVSAVVRLNEAATYDASAFTSRGIDHHDLYFDDCTAPSAQLVADFHDKCAREPGRVAVHCFAGLGRTGTLIATWIMKEHGWSAREAMAWVRIVRPGSVIGPQQHFLEHYEELLRLPAGHPSLSELGFTSIRHPATAEHSQLLAAQLSSACLSRAL